jgi:hypothetical protein
MSEQLSAQGYAPVPEFYTGAWANVGFSLCNKAVMKADSIFRSIKAFMALTEIS